MARVSSEEVDCVGAACSGTGSASAGPRRADSWSMPTCEREAERERLSALSRALGPVVACSSDDSQAEPPNSPGDVRYSPPARAVPPVLFPASPPAACVRQVHVALWVETSQRQARVVPSRPSAAGAPHGAVQRLAAPRRAASAVRSPSAWSATVCGTANERWTHAPGLVASV